MPLAIVSLLLVSSPIPWSRAHPYENTQPKIADVQQAEAWKRGLGSNERDLKTIRISKLRCLSLPISDFKLSDFDWNVEAVAQCRYELALDSGNKPDRPVKKTELLTYKRNACGEEGQEVDLWCFFWRIDDLPKR